MEKDRRLSATRQRPPQSDKGLSLVEKNNIMGFRVPTTTYVTGPGRERPMFESARVHTIKHVGPVGGILFRPGQAYYLTYLHSTPRTPRCSTRAMASSS